MDEYSEWGEEKQRQMYEFWDENLGEKHGLGFEVFTSPVLRDPSVLFIGTNPGGSLDEGETYHARMRDTFLQGDFSTPDTHHYASDQENYPVAKELRETVFVGYEEYLTDSVETNYYFLRTSREQGHNDLKQFLEDKWEEYIKFCSETITELVEMCSPKIIIAFTLKIYDKLMDDPNYESEEIENWYRPTDGDRKIRLLCSGTIDNRPIIGFHHPTYWGDDDREKIRRLMPPILAENLD